MKINKYMKTLRKCIKILKKYKRSMIIVYGLYFSFSAMMPIFIMLINQQMLNNVQRKSDFWKSCILLVGYIVINIINSTINNFFSIYEEKNIGNFEKYIDMLSLKKAEKISLEMYENSETYDLIVRAKEQGGAKIIGFIQKIFQSFKAILTLISVMIVIAQYEYWLIFFVCIIPIIRYSGIVGLNKKQFNIYCERTAKEREAEYINYLFFSGLAYKELKIFGLAEHLINKFGKIQDKLIEQDVGIVKKYSYITIVLNTMEFIFSGIIFFKFILDGYKGKILLGDISLLWNSLGQIKMNIGEISDGITEMFKELWYVELYFRFLDLQEIEENREKEKIESIESIRFASVSFKYKGRKDYTLKNISFVLTKERWIAFLGVNGSGKTTLIKLLLGLYENYEGEIYINGIELRKVDKYSYWRQMGVVFQDFVKYEASVRENIGFGKLEEIHNDTRILEAIQASTLSNIIHRNELDTVLGTWFGKKQLSMGQWQKIAIARLVFSNSKVLILDEPDSSLDIEARKSIYQYLEKQHSQKIGLFISHCINSFNEIVDEIIVLENGEIVEKGDVESLIKKKGRYYEFCVNIK